MVCRLYPNKNIFYDYLRPWGGIGPKKKNQWANKCLVCKMYKTFIVLKLTHPILSPPTDLRGPNGSLWASASQPWLHALESP